MAGGFRSRVGSWLGGISAGSSTNSVSGSLLDVADTFSGSITLSGTHPSFRSMVGFWLGGFSKTSLGTNAISGSLVDTSDTLGGSILFGTVVSGDLIDRTDIFSGLLFDPHGKIDTGFLFEAD